MPLQAAAAPDPLPPGRESRVAPAVKSPTPRDTSLFEAADTQAAEAPRPTASPSPAFPQQNVGGAHKEYVGETISLSLKDGDIKDVLRSFAKISGLNVVVQPGVRGTVTVELESVPWDQALDQILKINNLGYELDGNIMRIAPRNVLEVEAKEQQALAQAQSLSIPLRTVIKRISYSKANDLARVLSTGGGRSSGIMSQRGSVTVDQRTNTLIIKELPSYIDTVIAVIETLDIPEPQVMIEARIVETTKRFSRTLGITWGFQGIADAAHGNTTGLQFPNNGSVEGSVNVLTGGNNGLLQMSLGNILNTFNLDATLQAAESDGLINILSAPKIATLNNEAASIQSGLQIPIQTVANNTVTVQYVNATLRLDVTPHVTAEGTVLMDVNVQKREPQIAFAIAGATNAPISTKEAQTRVIVRDGGTTVIGGIYKVSTDQGQDRVPGLANIPVLGHLFKNRRREDSNEELLIFITPRVIKL
jgi:type IV pilus assembly protein PilQ